VIVIKVIPSFEDFYRTFDAELPLGTRIIVQASTFIRQYLPFVVGGVAAAVIVGWGSITSSRMRIRLDRLVLRAPLIGTTAQQFATSQLARTLATLLGGGIPLVNSLEIAARSVSNRYLAAELLDVGQRVREGESLTAALAAKSVVPDVALKMVEVGESTGALQDMLNSLADFYDEAIETALSRFVSLVEPALLVIMGIVIGSLLLALYFPLIRLMSVVGG
jgi:type IV pilus assembly protein PilC